MINWKALFRAVLFVLGYATLGISAVLLFLWGSSKLGGLVVGGGVLVLFLLLMIAERYWETKDHP